MDTSRSQVVSLGLVAQLCQLDGQDRRRKMVFVTMKVEGPVVFMVRAAETVDIDGMNRRASLLIPEMLIRCSWASEA